MGNNKRKFYTSKGEIIQSAIAEDVIKTLKRISREEYGFQPTRVTVNRRKYDRTRSKREFKRDQNSLFSFNKIYKIAI
jgi:hypothetical protein